MTLVTTTTPINIKMHQINDNLSTHVPRRIFVHHPLNGGQLGDLPRWSSPRRDPFGGPPLSPHVGSNGSNQHLSTHVYANMVSINYCTTCMRASSQTAHTRSYNIQPMWMTLTQMLTLKYWKGH